MKFSKKSTISLILVAATLLTMTVGSFAYFTDRVEVEGEGKAGTLTIALDKTSLSLLDADGKDILNPGDKRDIVYTVSNTGNKSADIKETIYLTAYDTDGLDKNFSATQSEFEIYNKDDVEYITNEGYKPKADAQPLEVKALNGNIITYSIPVYTLNGNSTLAEQEVEDGITTDTKTSEYVLVFKTSTLNDWQDALLKMDLLVQAKQHRNTENIEWTTLQTATTILSNDNDLNVVEKATEINDPQSDDDEDDESTEPAFKSGKLMFVRSATGLSVQGLADDTDLSENSDIEIPETVDGEVVNDIAEGAFEGNTEITNVIIPESVTTVGDNAFANTTSLESVTIQGTSTTLGENALGSDSLEAVYYPKLTTDDYYRRALSNNTAVVLKDEEFDGDYVYKVINDNEIEIEDISKTLKTQDTITIPEQIDGKNVTSIGNNAFTNNNNLTNLTLSANINNIGISAFEMCSSLNNVTILSDEINLQYSAFLSCNLNGDTINNIMSKTTTIPDYAFMNNGYSSDFEITIPATITSIGDQAFVNSTNLTKVTILGTDTVINYRAFYGCDKLTQINLPNAELSSIENSPWEAVYAEVTWKNGEKEEDNTVASGDFMVKQVGEYMTITGLSEAGLTKSEITIPETIEDKSVNKIAKDAFKNNTKITSITIPSNIIEIQANAFANTVLEDVIIEANSYNISINDSAFATETIENITFTNASRNTINGSPWGATNAQILYNGEIIENNIVYTPYDENSYAVAGLTVEGKNLETITIPETINGKNVTRINSYAFSQTNIKTINLPATVTTFESSAFYYNPNLTTINIAAENINYSSDSDWAVFQQCNLDQATIQSILNKTDRITMQEFYGNTNTEVNTLTIPATITTIGDCAFSSMASLNTVIIEGTSITIPLNAFENTTSITSIQLPNISEGSIEYAPWGATNATVTWAE